MAIEEQITNLIQKYRTEPDRNQTEADIQAGYIDQLFLSLGWNIYNEPGQLTSYRRQGYLRGAGIIDVGLEVAGEPALILEAKRFGVIPRSNERTGDRTTEEKQLFRYARSRKIPFGILTNFERFHVFNADHERLILAFDDPQEYLSRLPELLRLSPDKVKAGSLPAWERQLEIRDIDETFLASLQQWRLRLANAIYQNNLSHPVLQTDGQFDFDKLMAAVQRILDRLILIRFADDKEVLLTFDVLESTLSYYHKLGAYAGREHLRQEFIRLSQIMDEHHNTTLFQPGHICEQVILPNETLAQIMEEMSNISFRKFTSDILGNTYETYLGTRLVLRNGEIKSETRRDIRKAGGIFFTPPMIVHYIVDNTLGSLLRELERQHGLHAIEKAQAIKVLDPACGSGSFLIYAYQVLANFYRRMNQQIEAEQMKLLAAGTGADMFGRLEQFKHLPSLLLDYPHHILKNQLYGVDIDPEAAEIAAVNLTMQAFADSKREKLPLILGENIKVGNSLISGTEEELRHYFGDAWQVKKPFNWEKEFEDIMADGGFDVVIGNPPYVGFHGFAEEKPYLKSVFQSAQGRFDLYLPFIEKGIQILKQGGLLGFICPTNFMKRQHGQGLREFLQQNSKILKIVDFEHYPVFEEALNYTGIFIFEKSSPTANHYIEYIPRQVDEKPIFLKQTNLDSQGWAIREEKAQKVIDKIKEQANPPLSKLVESISEGIVTGQNQIYLLTQEGANNLGLEAQLLKPAIRGKEIQRYFPPLPHNMVIYPYRNIKGDCVVIPEEELKNHYPVAWEYLNSKKELLSGRDYFNKSAKTWYEIWCERTFRQQEVDKILVRELSPSNQFAYCDRNTFYMDTVCGIIPKDKNFGKLLYLLGLLNSTLLEFVYKQTTVPKAGGFYIYKTMFLKNLPIRRIDFNNPVEKKRHADLVALVDRMLELNKRLAPIRDTACAEREELLRQVEQTDQEIDNLVYDLYGLTEEERKIVEGATKSQEEQVKYRSLPRDKGLRC